MVVVRAWALQQCGTLEEDSDDEVVVEIMAGPG